MNNALTIGCRIKTDFYNLTKQKRLLCGDEVVEGKIAYCDSCRRVKEVLALRDAEILEKIDEFHKWLREYRKDHAGLAVVETKVRELKDFISPTKEKRAETSSRTIRR